MGQPETCCIARLNGVIAQLYSLPPTALAAAAVLALALLACFVLWRRSARRITALQAAIDHLSHHDGLTGLPNRRWLRTCLTGALHPARPPLSLLHLDLDRFGAIGTLLGHAAGDAVLAEAARRLREQIAADETLAHIGGDEFVLLTPREAPGALVTLSERLIRSLARPFEVQGHRIELGVSIGVARFPADSATADALMQAAETALHRAKRDGRGTFRFFVAAMDQDVALRRRLEHDLRHAVDRNELTLHYQPLVSCLTGDVDGFEALLRWHHPDRGTIPPLDFIGIAEESGLILEIGRWVLDTACQTAAGWAEPRWVAVNISPVQFRHANVFDLVSQALARSGLPANRLELEITEGILMEDTARALEVLSKLRALGVRIALDDFGTGYSSLSYLRSFTFDKLKIDRSFIRGLGESEDAALIVRTIIGLAHNLGLSITAEGVETAEQLAMVRDHLCDEVQGYLLGRPLPMGDFTEETETRSRSLLLEAAR